MSIQRVCMPLCGVAVGFAVLFLVTSALPGESVLAGLTNSKEPFAVSCPAEGKPTDMRTLKDPHTYEALAFVPDASKHPLLLYLHGAGEMRGDVQGIISEGATGTPPVELAFDRAPCSLTTRFIVVAPHSSRGWSVEMIEMFLDYLLSESGLQIDPARLYVTGHSMGGAGALFAASSGRFAAAVPVAPSGAPAAERLQGVPVWAFHGKNDVIVPSFVSTGLVEALWNAGASKDHVKLTLYDDAPAPPGWPDYYGHASTIPAYATPELYEWLLQHQLPV
ncbi:unnamed protein product [Effrenium voratum]|nr:unnamed protein product [Effrenium voratum]